MSTNRRTMEFDRIERVLKSVRANIKSRLFYSETVEHLGRMLNRRSIILEVAAISIATLAFSSGVLNFDPTKRLPGLEADVFQFLDWALVQSLTANNSFPLWNPYLDTGHPYIADPMLHAYNPVITLPVLLLGVTKGFRIGIVLSFILAALGMWFLGLTLGLRRVTRLWLALMFAFAGQPVARFFQGQYLFILGFSWIPWILAFYLRALETGRRSAAALTVICLALLFFSGNVYYSFFTLIVLVTISLTQIIRLSNSSPHFKVDGRKLRTAAWIALLALGLIAIQLLPSIQYRPYVNKARNVVGSHNLRQIFLDLTSRDPYRPDAYDLLPAREEFYAYIGYSPFLALPFLPLAIRRKWKWLLPFSAILLVTILWITVDYLPWRDAFYSAEWLAQFRHLLRVLIFTSLALLVISALVFDHLFDRIDELLHQTDRNWLRFLQFKGVHLAHALLALIMGIGLLDLYVTHRPIATVLGKTDGVYDAAAWLREYDQGVYYVRHNPNNFGHEALVSNNLRFIDAWYHFTEIRRIHVTDWDYPRQIEPTPNYIIQSQISPEIEADAVEQIITINERDVFKLPLSLPFAFVVPTEALTDRFEVGSVRIDEVEEVVTPYASTNSIELIHRGNANETLVILSSYYPGWQAIVDGQRRILKNASGFLATDIIPGATKYEFVYRPGRFYLGLGLSSLTLAVMAGWIWQERLLPHFPWLRSVQVWLKDAEKRRVTFRAALNSLQLRAAKILEATGLTKFTFINKPGPAEHSESPAEELSQEPDDLNSAFRAWLRATRTLASMIIHPPQVPMLLFGLSLLAYLTIRFIGLSEFPIYFFTDEAVQTVLAADLVRDGFHGYDGVFLPTYFENAWLFNLSLSVYAQVLPFLLFGKSVFVTRATSVLIGGTAAIAVGLTLRDTFKIKSWWAGVLVLSAVPAWFLHSRTAFETVMFVAFMAWTLYFYLRYRQDDPRFLYAVVISGALSFYSYRGGQLVLVGFVLALFLIDIRYHFKHRRTVLGALLLGLVFTIPYFRFQLVHRDETYFHLRMLDTYWLYEIPLQEKIARFVKIYLNGLDPRFWFSPLGRELNRHVMRGHGHISPFMALFLIIGLGLGLVNLDKPEYRTVIALALLSPLGAALVGIGITRVLIFVIPAALLTTIGISALITRSDRVQLAKLLNWLLFAILLLFNSYLLRDALKEGPTWFQDYGLGGMQYGARQVFETAEELIDQDPDRRVYTSSTWANGTDILMRFFIPDGSPAYIGNAEGFLDRQLELNDDMVFILTAEEFGRLRDNPKVAGIEVLDSIDLPNGRTGFYVTTFAYSAEAERIFAQEQEEREQPSQGVTEWAGQTIQVHYPYLDMGDLHHMFDDDPFTLARVHSANPAIFTFTFERPTSLAGIEATTGSMSLQLSAQVLLEGQEQPMLFADTYTDLPDDPTVALSFNERLDDIVEIRLEILSLSEGDPFKIHIRELGWYSSQPTSE